MSAASKGCDFQSLFQALPGLFLVFDRTLRIVAASDGYARAAGRRREEMVDRDLSEAFASGAAVAAEVSEVEDSLRRVLLTGAPEAMTERPYTERNSAAERFGRPFNTPVDVGGVRTYLLHRVEDVTELVRIQALIAQQGRVHESLREQTRELDRVRKAIEEQQRAILASLSAHIAVVDHTGRIVAVNPAWEVFARDNAGVPERCNVGANYLDVCRSAVGENAVEAEHALAGLQAVLDGTASEFTLEYPCHSPTQQRWFLLQATPLRDGSSGVVVSHTNITDRVKAERALRERQERLSAILNTATDAIIVIDRGGVIESVNPAAETMFGYTAAEMVGQNVKMLMPPPYRDEHDSYLARCHQAEEPLRIATNREVAARRKDGSVFPVDLAVNRVHGLGQFTGIIRDVSRRKELEREVVENVSLEQRRIGQDLHDSVGQELTALNMLASDLLEILPTDPATALQVMHRMAEGLRRSHHELRTVLRGLLPVAVDSQGLMAALADLADRTGQDQDVQCTFDCPRPVAVANNLTATHLYLIAQEAVHNAVKHGKPRNIRISLEVDHLLMLRVLDDGVGMPARPAEGEGLGLGLRIMRNRAAIIGATLTIEPAWPGGILVSCILTRKQP